MGAKVLENACDRHPWQTPKGSKAISPRVERARSRRDHPGYSHTHAKRTLPAGDAIGA